MIDEGRTLEIYGYTSDELSPHSNKPVVAVCEECGTYRVVRKGTYKELCCACSHRKHLYDAACSVCGEVGVHAKGMCKRCYMKQYRANLTQEQRDEINTSQRKSYKTISPEQIEKRNARQRNDNLTQEQIDKKNACRRKENLTPEQMEKKNARQRNDNLTPEQIDKRKARMLERKHYKNPDMPYAGTEEYRINMSCAQQGISIDEWDGYAVESKYCPKFNEACKERNREKYGRRCFICNKTEAENGKRLSVHHVDMNKAQGCDGHVWQLVPVCMKHHSGSHNDTWQARIEYLLNNVWGG